MAEYQGVDVEHPRIVEAIKTLAKQDKQIYEIAKIVGMPYEVVQKYVAREKKK
jgi:hypothetical protein